MGRGTHLGDRGCWSYWDARARTNAKCRPKERSSGSGLTSRSLQPAWWLAMGTWTGPTIILALASSLLGEGLTLRRALVLAGASGIPFAVHHTMIKSTACWVVLAHSAAVRPIKTTVMSSAYRMGSKCGCSPRRSQCRGGRAGGPIQCLAGLPASGGGPEKGRGVGLTGRCGL